MSPPLSEFLSVLLYVLLRVRDCFWRQGGLVQVHHHGRNSLTVHYVSFHSVSQTVFPFSAVMGVPNLETSLACCQDGRGGHLTGRGDGGAVCQTASYKVSASY